MLLNECYLAMGFKSRYVTCFPKVYINDCHVINSVYSNTLHKWIWMDPTFAAFMSKDEIKHIEEEYAKTETPVVSNNSAHRWTPDVPMIIPEINPEHEKTGT